MPTEYEFEQLQLVPRPLDEVFAFFADAQNLERITPDFLHFKILTPPPIEMRAGALIDYQIRLFGLPMKWRTEIEAWEPGVRFIDRQIRGPYKSWRHTHEFHRTSEGTLITDRVQYQMPLGPLGTLARRFFVQRTLEQIFAHRYRVIGEVFS